jgi:hypothetical protein
MEFYFLILQFITLLQPAYCDGKLGPGQRFKNFHLCKFGYQELSDAERFWIDHLQMEAHIKKVSLEEFEGWRKREEQRKRSSTTSTTRRSYIVSTIVSTTVTHHEIEEGKESEKKQPGQSTTEMMLFTTPHHLLTSSVPTATGYQPGE